MPVRSDGYIQRRASAPHPRLTRTRILGLALVAVGLVVTVLAVISVAMR